MDKDSKQFDADESMALVIRYWHNSKGLHNEMPRTSPLDYLLLHLHES